jgi:hypothetical protein
MDKYRSRTDFAGYSAKGGDSSPVGMAIWSVYRNRNSRVPDEISKTSRSVQPIELGGAIQPISFESIKVQTGNSRGELWQL